MVYQFWVLPQHFARVGIEERRRVSDRHLETPVFVHIGNLKAVNMVDLARRELLRINLPQDSAIGSARCSAQKEFIDAIAINVKELRCVTEAKARHPVVHPAELGIAEADPEFMIENRQPPAHPSYHQMRGPVFLDVIDDHIARVGHGNG